jgi:hypothetical protein
MKFNKKIISLGCATLATSIIGTTVLASLALKQEEKKQTKEKTPACHPNYDHEYISSFIDHNYFIKKCLANFDHLIIDEAKFRENIGDMIKNALKRMNKFSNNANNYTIELNYQFVNETSVNLDVV